MAVRGPYPYCPLSNKPVLLILEGLFLLVCKFYFFRSSMYFFSMYLTCPEKSLSDSLASSSISFTISSSKFIVFFTCLIVLPPLC